MARSRKIYKEANLQYPAIYVDLINQNGMKILDDNHKKYRDIPYKNGDHGDMDQQSHRAHLKDNLFITNSLIFTTLYQQT